MTTATRLYERIIRALVGFTQRETAPKTKYTGGGEDDNLAEGLPKPAVSLFLTELYFRSGSVSAYHALDVVQLEDTAAATQPRTYPGLEPNLHGRIIPFEEFREPTARCYNDPVVLIRKFFILKPFGMAQGPW